MATRKTEKKREYDGQYSVDDYQMKQVEVRLKLMDGPAYYSKTPLAKPADAARVMCDVMMISTGNGSASSTWTTILSR